MGVIISMLRRFFRHVRSFSLWYAFVEFFIVVDRRFSKTVNKKESLRLLQAKERYVLNYLFHLLDPLISEFNNTEEEKLQTRNRYDGNDTIWVCWLQGMQHAPEIVKQLIANIEKQNLNHTINVVTYENYTKYCTLPPKFLSAYNKNNLPPQAFADMLRITLLSKLGGVWVDGTMLLVHPLPEEVFSLPTYCVKGIDPNFKGSNRVIGSSEWQAYLISSTPNSVTYSFMYRALCSYFDATSDMIDYFLISYINWIARNYVRAAAQEYEMIPNNNPLCEFLSDYLDTHSSINHDVLLRLKSSKTWAYKLSWKKKYNLSGRSTNGDVDSIYELQKLLSQN